jgi:sRNA-binding regulator protein Hfq
MKETYMRTDIENKEQIKEQNKETRKEPKKEQKKEKKSNIKEHPSIIKNFIGKDIEIILRNGTNLKGKLETVAQYELVITSSYTPIVVMKHAIDYLTLVGEK